MAKRPVLTLCGSTRFKAEFEFFEKELTLAGYVVLSVCCFGHQDNDPRIEEAKEMLDAIHLQKIDMADEIGVIDPGGYIGASTKQEIEYAKKQGKKISFMSEAYDDL